MIVRFQTRTKALDEELDSGTLFREIRPKHRIPRLGIAGSIALHVLLIWFAMVGPRAARHAESPNLYATMIAPEEKKIIWYKPAPKLPDVSPSAAQKTPGAARTRQVSPDLLISEQNAAPGKQIVYNPQPKIELPRDIEAPNIVLPKVELPAPPPPPAPAVIKPPEPTPPPGPPKQPIKTFLPPKESPKLPVQPQTNTIEAAPALVASAPANPDPRFAAVPRLPGPPPRKFVAPTPPSPTTGAGNSPSATPTTIQAPQVDVQSSNTAAAVLGLRPTDINVAIPPGVRRASISAGPGAEDPKTASGSKTGIEAGAPPGAVVPQVTASAGVKAESLRPGISVKSEPSAPALPPSPDQKRIWDAVRTTLLAPQRPSSRVIPARIESLFTGRIAYVASIQVIDDLNFSGDWVFWFAERNGASSGNAIVRAPVPVSTKTRIPRTPDGSASSSASVQLLATIRADGSVEGVQIFRGWDDQTNRLAIATLEALTFLPALKNNAPIDAESVIEMPFHPRH